MLFSVASLAFERTLEHHFIHENQLGSYFVLDLTGVTHATQV